MDAIQFIYLIPLLPLAGFIINGLGRNYLSKSMVGIIGSGVVFLSFGLSVMVFVQMLQPGFVAQNIRFFNFISIGSLIIPFEFQIDQLTSLFLMVITGVGFLIHLYSTGYMKEETQSGFGRYFAYLNLFVFSMLILVMGGNYVLMYMGWEGVSLCSYLLIGFWFKDHANNNAAKKAFIMNRIGDMGFLLAILWMISLFGTVSYDELFNSTDGLITALSAMNTTDMVGISLLLFVGAASKSAQIPLYTWLPDAMAGPTPVSALIHAATMVTAGIYMIARSNILYSLAPMALSIIAVIGVATALFAAIIALKQNDIKKVLAYSTVSQLGYMFLGLGVGAYTAAVFHVITHAFFKGLLFLAAGSVIHAMSGEQNILKMGGLSKKLKTTFITFLIATIAIAGIPPFSGFFSKDEILNAAFAQSPVLFAVGLLGSLLTAFYMFRLLGLTFGGKFRGTDAQLAHVHESPAVMTLPLIILAILSAIGGFIGIPEVFAENSNWLHQWLAPIFARSGQLLPMQHVAHSTEIILIALTSGLAIIISIFAYMKYKKYQGQESSESAIGRWIENKFYVDELYDFLFVKPYYKLSRFIDQTFDKKGIDGIVNGVGKSVQYGSRQFRLLQSGQVGSYLLLMVLGILLLFIVQLFLK